MLPPPPEPECATTFKRLLVFSGRLCCSQNVLPTSSASEPWFQTSERKLGQAGQTWEKIICWGKVKAQSFKKTGSNRSARVSYGDKADAVVRRRATVQEPAWTVRCSYFVIQGHLKYFTLWNRLSFCHLWQFYGTAVQMSLLLVKWHPNEMWFWL